MAASITDKISRVTDSTTGRPIIATLASAKAIGAASVSLGAATNWSTFAKLHFAIYTVTAAGIKDMTSQTDWMGVLSGTTLSGLVLTGGTDRAYNAGAIVEITPTARYAKDLYDWAMSFADQTGALLPAAVQTAIGAGGISSANLGQNVQAANLATNAIKLGSGSATTAQLFTAGAGNTQVTGLTASVTIPAGGRSIEVEAYIPSMTAGGAAVATISIWDGAVGSGVVIMSTNYKMQDSGDTKPFTIKTPAITPAAGSKTYNVSISSSSANTQSNPTTGAPAWLTVRAI